MLLTRGAARALQTRRIGIAVRAPISFPYLRAGRRKPCLASSEKGNAPRFGPIWLSKQRPLLYGQRRCRLHLHLLRDAISRFGAKDGFVMMLRRLPPYSAPSGNVLTCSRCVVSLHAQGRLTRWSALDSLHGHVALLSWDLTIRYGTRAVSLAWPATTPCASHTRRLNEKNRSFSSARGPLRARGGHLRSHGGGAHGRSTRDGCSCCSRVLRLYGARESELLQPKLLPTADLLVLLVYIWGKRGTSLAQMLDWRSLFPQAPPINGLC